MKPTPSEQLLNLRFEMLKKRMSQKELSELSDVTEEDISRIFNGWLNHPEKFEKLVKAVGSGRRIRRRKGAHA